MTAPFSFAFSDLLLNLSRSSAVLAGSVNSLPVPALRQRLFPASAPLLSRLHIPRAFRVARTPLPIRWFLRSRILPVCRAAVRLSFRRRPPLTSVPRFPTPLCTDLRSHPPHIGAPVVPNRSFVRIPRSGEPALCTADNGTAGRIHGMNPHGEGVRNSVWEGIYPNSPAERNEKSSDRLMMM